MFARLVPGPLVRWFASPYVAGGSMEDALEVAAAQLASGVRSTLDLLGEAVTRQGRVAENVAAYERLLDAIGADPRFPDPATRPSVSLKPSAFTAGAMDAARGPIGVVAERARLRGVALTIDMEDHRWTDRTLEWSVDLFRRGYDVGTVLQTRLHRTEADLRRIPAGMRLRLVIGIYPEAADVALTDKRAMKERMIVYAADLLDRGARVEFATHDEDTLFRFAAGIAPRAPERCEIQMLLGVPRRAFLARLASGELGPRLPVRLYVPFALSWADATAYLRRRMAESPNVIWLVLQNLARGPR
jgi:proline dehydrogenase